MITSFNGCTELSSMMLWFLALFVIFHLKWECLPCSPKCHNDIRLTFWCASPFRQRQMFLLYLFGVLMFHTEPHFHNISLCMRDGQDICPVLYRHHVWRTDSKAVKLNCFIGTSGWYGNVNFKKCVDPSPTLFTYLSLSPFIPSLASQACDQSGLLLWLLLHNVGFYLPERH